MKKTFLFLALAAVLLLGLTPAMAYDTFSFYRITSTNVENLLGQLFMDVYYAEESAPNPAGGTVDILDDQVGFYFYNTGPIASNIAEIYFDDGTLLAQEPTPTIYDNPDSVDFDGAAGGPVLPGGANLNPVFVATAAFSSGATNPQSTKGIGPGEALLLKFTTENEANVYQALTDLGTLRVGLHVTGIGTAGSSDSYVNYQTAGVVPLPGALVLLGAGLVRLAAYGRRRRHQH